MEAFFNNLPRNFCYPDKTYGRNKITIFKLKIMSAKKNKHKYRASFFRDLRWRSELGAPIHLIYLCLNQDLLSSRIGVQQTVNCLF